VNYTHIRFAFYETYTYQQYEPARLPVGAGLINEARFRAKYLLDVARHVQAVIAQTPDPPGSRVLTIFLAPEFFFRSSQGQRSGHGHYGLHEIQAAQAVLKAGVKNDPVFKDWLLAPGTMIRSVAMPDPNDPLGGWTYAITNEAWVVAKAATVGQPGGGVVEWTYLKQDFSTIDNLDIELNARVSGVKSAALTSQQILTVDNVVIGIDICLDHPSQVLRDAVTTARPPHNDFLRLDVHLIVSCGADAEDTCVAARLDGYVLRCNGNNYSPPRARAYQITQWPAGKPTRGTKARIAELQSITTAILPPDLQINPTPGLPEVDKVGFGAPAAL
jgi:hypothetical protein